jgi:hypothetical protein
MRPILARRSGLLRFNGIFRDVYIEAVPPVTVHDLRVPHRADADFRKWTLRLDAECSFHTRKRGNPAPALIRDGTTWLDERIRTVLPPADATSFHSPIRFAEPGTGARDGRRRGMERETPALYDLYISIAGRDGT